MRGKKARILILTLLVAVSGSLMPIRDIQAASCTLQGNTITVSCDFAPGTYYYNGTFTVNSGITVTAGNASTPGQVVIIADDIYVYGTMDANGLGSASAAGSCPGTTATNGAGACHGGDGGRSTGNNAGGIAVYGSATAPTTLGSGGGDDTNIAGQQGGAGGGAFMMATWSSTGTFTLASTGVLRANGASGVSNEGGGGSGGSIFLDVGTAHGTGTITANGGNGSGTGATGAGGGGGGRFAFHYTSSTATYSVSAFGGNRGTTTSFSAQVGGAGTRFVWDKDEANGSLTVDNNNQHDTPFTRQRSGDDYTFKNIEINRAAQYRIPPSTTLTVESGGGVSSTAARGYQPKLWIFGTFNAPSEAWALSALDVHQFGTVGVVKYLTYDNGVYSVDTSSALFSAGRGNRLESLTVSGTSGYAIFSASSTTQLFVDTLTVKSGGMVTHASNTTLAAGIQHQLSVSATTTIDVQSGGSISAFGKGYAVSEGTGAGTDSTGSGGGAYGGDGGRGVNSNGGTSGYGSVTQPVDPGSGGGANGSAGNPGGGIIKLTANGGAGTITIDGTVAADGGTGFGTVAGGGSGGSVWIDVPTGTLSGSGMVSANGGNASTTSSGGGGGGRVAVYYAGSHALTLDAYGGSRSVPSGNWFHGGAGTVYEKTNAETNGNLTVDNDDLFDAPLTRQPASTSLTMKDVRIRFGANYLIPTGSTLTVEADTGTIAGNGRLGLRPSLRIQGTLNYPSQAYTLAGLDVHHSGTVGVLKYLTYDSGVYSLDTAQALFTAGRGNRLESLTVSGTSGYAIFSASSTTQLFVDTLTVKSGGMVTHATNTTTAAGIQHQLSVSATTTITVESGGAIDTSGKGYRTSEGPGQGGDATSGNDGGGGGAYGGDGGDSTAGGLPGGGFGYGSITQPTDPGSGGGMRTLLTTNDYGTGGGIIKLTANGGAGTVTIDGAVASDGKGGPSGSGVPLTGSGAGGSVWIDLPTGTLAGSGTVRANGGTPAQTGTSSSAAGGGGRIALYYAGSHALDLQAKGGVSLEWGMGHGGAGSVYEKPLAETNGDLTFDNEGPIGDSGLSRWASPSSLTVKNLRIRDDAHAHIASGLSLTIEAVTGTVTGGGSQDNQPSLRVNGTFTMPTEAMTVAGLDIHHTGTIGNLKYLTWDNGIYNVETASALFSAGRGNRLETLTVSGTSGYAIVSASTTGALFVDVLTVKGGGMVTHASNTTTALGTQHRLIVSATTSVVVQSGGALSAYGKGFEAGQGTGAGQSGFTGSGAGYGGNGGHNGAIAGGSAYIRVDSPTFLGSGGGPGTAGSGGNGGGAVQVIAPTMTLDGTVAAESFTTFGTNQGGGSGGSVYLDVDTLLGSGTISANAQDTLTSSAGGGGGRIAVFYGTNSSSVTMTAYGGQGTSITSAMPGGAGTIYLKADAATDADLIVLNDIVTTALTPQLNATETYANVTIGAGSRYEIGTGETLTVASGGTFSSPQPNGRRATLVINGTFNPPSASPTLSQIDVFHNATIGVATSLTLTDVNYNLYTAGAQFSAGPGNRLNALTLNANTVVSTTSTATLFLDTLTMNAGSILRHATNTGVRQHVTDISATTSITVASGALIDADAKGFAGGMGPGRGLTGNVAGGGAHGGDGGRGNPSSSGTAGGTAYDSITEPLEMGSGGGDSTSTSADNPAGGGAVKLAVNSGGTIAVDGTIDVDGQTDPGSGFDGGGGAGGSIWIHAPGGTVSGSGALRAEGGGADSTSSAGGGGGGRIAVYYSGTAPSFTYALMGGIGYGDGGAGTLYTKSTAQTHGTLLVDNDGSMRTSFTTQPASNTSITFDAVTIREGGDYRVPSGRVTTVASAGDCSALAGGGPEDGVLTIEGTFNTPNAACTFTDLDVRQYGTLGTITSMTVANATYSVYTAGAQWSAGPGNRLTNLTLDSGGVYSASSTAALFVGVFTANNGSFVTHASNTTTSAASNTLYISATSSIAFNAGATVMVQGSGYAVSEGSGQGVDGTSGSGAGHGGAGGTSNIGGLGGAAYDDPHFPADSGSGGGEDTGTGGARGGPGGGAIRLVTPENGTLTIDAAIDADGVHGLTGDDSGGGAGGSIWIHAGTVTIAANLSADGGGAGSVNGGCGGGGRIAVYYASLSFDSGTATARTGCTTARGGETGSIYFAQSGTPPVGPTNGFTRILPSVIGTGDTVVISASATDDIGVTSIELYLDGTGPSNLVKTCTFSPAQTPASCEHALAGLVAGAHSVTVKSYDGLSQTDTDTTNFSVAGDTASNRLELSTYKKGATATFNISFTLSATSTGTLTVTFPDEFTVTAAATAGSGCLSSFGFSSTTLTATKTDCVGAVTMTGATVTNPSTAGQYTVTFTNDNGSGVLTIVDDDNFNITATVDPILTFNVGTNSGSCSGAFAGSGGTLSLGNLVTSSVSTSDSAGVPHICTRLSTNAPGGAVVTVRSQNAALASISAPAHAIPSGTATLVAGTTGYGLCAGSGGSDTGLDTTTPVGASPVRAGPFGGSCTTSSHQVGGLTTSPQILWSVNDPTQNAFARIFVKAAIGTGVVTHNDYADTLTFIATAVY